MHVVVVMVVELWLLWNTTWEPPPYCTQLLNILPTCTYDWTDRNLRLGNSKIMYIHQEWTLLPSHDSTAKWCCGMFDCFSVYYRNNGTFSCCHMTRSGVPRCSSHSSEWATVVVLPLQIGFTALMKASNEGHDVVVDALLKAGATVDVEAKVLLYWTLYQLFTSCLNPHTCTHDQLVLE